MSIHPRTPVLIGVGQVVRHWDGADAETAPSPQSLNLEAAHAALADSGAAEAVAGSIDVLVVVRTNADSLAGTKHPHGRCANPPATLAADLGLNVRRAVHSTVGGDQPQALVNEFAQAVFAGEARTVLLSGAEAAAAVKTAARARIRLDWSRSVDAGMEDRGLGKRLLSEYEIANGLGMPTQTYPAFENALRVRLGHGPQAHLDMMSELWAAFSEVAAQNPYSQFPVARSAEFLKTPSKENYKVAEPYLKWHVAQDAVNLSAAVILTSVEEAQRLGVDPAKWVYLHGYAQAVDRYITERADLSRSQAMELVLNQALRTSGRSLADISLADLYSCFPCAVLIAAEAIGLDWRKTVPTVTGGLPFFGGPGNNYSMHAIATMAERLRAAPDAYGLVLANGGFLSKEAAGVYSARPREDWTPVSCAEIQAAIDATPAVPLASESGQATIETCTVTYRRGAPDRGYVIARTAGGERILARARTGHRTTLAALASADPIGKTVRIAHEDGVNFIEPADRIGDPAGQAFLSRSFKYVTAERRGHVLEVTIDRPDQLNALHSAAHFELHEIWDEFERDRDLWLAIVTGAGDRAFSSGNDLKATARGGDMSIPRSGFAGICSRFAREKPVIAAVNGVAMGGGLEIVLACDLAVADERAKLALPEVHVGLYAAAGGVQRLTRHIGRKAAMELILTGRHVDAAEALSLGVVNEIAPPGESLAAARRLAERILVNSPSAVRASKQALNKFEEIEALKEALDANGPIFGRLMRTRDFKEGVAAFAEKRTPQWTNS